jgi:hypothetical protein
VLRPEFVRRKLQRMVDDLALLETLGTVEYDVFSADPVGIAAAERIIERVMLRALEINDHVLGAAAAAREAEGPRRTDAGTFLRLAELDTFSPTFGARIAQGTALLGMLQDAEPVDPRTVHGAIGGVLREYQAYVDYLRRSLER